MFDDTSFIAAMCPGCGKGLDTASSTDGSDDRPVPGDISVCLYCGTLGEYTAGNPLGIRILTTEERDEVLEGNASLKLVLAIRQEVMVQAVKEGKVAPLSLYQVGVKRESDREGFVEMWDGERWVPVCETCGDEAAYCDGTRHKGAAS